VAPEGTYEADVVLLDEYGNRTITPRVSFGLSYDHLVARHRFVSVSGEQFSKKDQDNSCGLKIRPGASKYAHGAVLDYCGKRDADVSLVAYVVRAPKAAYLHTLNAAVYGRSPSGNNVALIAWNWDRPKRSVTRLAGPREGLHAAGSAYSVEHFVDDDGWALVWAGFAGQGRYDYDIRDIGFKFTYGVLVS
jgi:hypothetical protein